MVGATVATSKVAVNVRSVFGVVVQVAVVLFLHGPAVHFLNTEPGAGVAVRVSEVFCGHKYDDPEHAVLQFITPLDEDTVPLPYPDFVT